jgi:hypothetical protein
MKLSLEQSSETLTAVVVRGEPLERDRLAGVFVHDAIHDRSSTATQRLLDHVATGYAGQRSELTRLSARR